MHPTILQSLRHRADDLGPRRVDEKVVSGKEHERKRAGGFLPPPFNLFGKCCPVVHATQRRDRTGEWCLFPVLVGLCRREVRPETGNQQLQQLGFGCYVLRDTSVAAVHGRQKGVVGQVADRRESVRETRGGPTADEEVTGRWGLRSRPQAPGELKGHKRTHAVAEQGEREVIKLRAETLRDEFCQTTQIAQRWLTETSPATRQLHRTHIRARKLIGPGPIDRRTDARMWEAVQADAGLRINPVREDPGWPLRPVPSVRSDCGQL